MTQADYTYDRDADCFVVTDDKGNELLRTVSPHEVWHKLFVSTLVPLINQGAVIFPTKEAAK